VEGLIKAQVLMLENRGKRLSVINFHGVARPGSKLDTPQRINHAKKLRLIWDSLPNPAKILCGDFNMYPDIESMKMLEGCGKNLIREFNIQNTRNEQSWKKYPGSRQTFADFTFVSPQIKVKTFEVPYNEVSDHLPMILEFGI
jgi:endonuclease/exonuclease/phosphatase family metal-dependent hydrolase